MAGDVDDSVISSALPSTRVHLAVQTPINMEVMNTFSETEGRNYIEALESALLGSIREGDGNWRFYFSGLELTAWGNISLLCNEAAFHFDDPFFHSVLQNFRSCELSSAELLESALILDFGGHTITIWSDDDGEMVSLLRDGENVADLWTLEDGTLTHSRGAREQFDSLI